MGKPGFLLSADGRSRDGEPERECGEAVRANCTTTRLDVRSRRSDVPAMLGAKQEAEVDKRHVRMLDNELAQIDMHLQHYRGSLTDSKSWSGGPTPEGFERMN